MKINPLLVLGAILSFAIGAYVNNQIYKKNNEELLAKIKEQIAQLNQNKARATPEQRLAIEEQQEYLIAQMNLIQQL